MKLFIIDSGVAAGWHMPPQLLDQLDFKNLEKAIGKLFDLCIGENQFSDEINHYISLCVTNKNCIVIFECCLCLLLLG